MNDLLLMVSNFDNARIIGFIFVCLVSLGLLYFKWTQSHLANIPLSTFQWAEIYLLAFVSFFSGIMVMGFVLVPKNAESLLDLVSLKPYIDTYSRQVQGFLLWAVNMLR